jgi:hypothetical protein
MTLCSQHGIHHVPKRQHSAKHARQVLRLALTMHCALCRFELHAALRPPANSDAQANPPLAHPALAFRPRFDAESSRALCVFVRVHACVSSSRGPTGPVVRCQRQRAVASGTARERARAARALARRADRASRWPRTRRRRPLHAAEGPAVRHWYGSAAPGGLVGACGVWPERAVCLTENLR